MLAPFLYCFVLAKKKKKTFILRNLVYHFILFRNFKQYHFFVASKTIHCIYLLASSKIYRISISMKSGSVLFIELNNLKSKKIFKMIKIRKIIGLNEISVEILEISIETWRFTRLESCTPKHKRSTSSTWIVNTQDLSLDDHLVIAWLIVN